jgi:hypothetical protein
MSTDTISPLRQRMIEDMNARKLCAATQTGHIRSCNRTVQIAGICDGPSHNELRPSVPSRW